MKKLEEFLEWGGVKKDVTFLILSGIALLASLLNIELFHVDLAWVAIILCGIPIILEAIIGLVTKFDIKADVLVSLALIASVIIGEIFAAGEVAFIMQLGGLLEDLTVAKARAGIEKLVHLTPRTARRISDEKETIIPAEQVQIGDTLRVLPGETIPVDGTILSGQTSINQAVMTGESLPVDKGAGDSVSSGTVNQFGSFDMKATKVGDDSSIQRMIKLVQSVDADKAKIVGIADRWATWIVVIALSAAALTWLISGQIIRAVTILVVFCPCALVLATPTAIMAAIGNATKHGFLVREGDALERLAEVSKITFDKTGTLTYGLIQDATEKFSKTANVDTTKVKQMTDTTGRLMFKDEDGKIVYKTVDEEGKTVYQYEDGKEYEGEEKDLKAVMGAPVIEDKGEVYTDANGKKVYKNTDQNGNEEFTYEDGSLFTGHYSELTQKIQEYNGKDSLMEEINAKFDEMDAEMTAAEEERAADNDTAVDEPVTYPESKAVDTEKRDAEAKELGLTPSDRDGAYMKETAFGTFLYVWDPETEEFKEFPAGEEGDEECDFTTSGNVIDRTNDKAVEADAKIALQEAGLNVVPGEPFIAEKDGTYYEYNKETGKFEEMKE